MLLVDDDEADIGQRREDRRARADGDAGLSLQDAAPLVIPLALGKAAVKHGDTIPEARAKASFGLGDEGDFRDEHQHGVARLHGAGRRPQVDLGLAAAGHAVEQKACESPAPGRRQRQPPQPLVPR